MDVARLAAHGFVPPPLPPGIEFSPELATALSAADRAVGALAGMGQALPDVAPLAQSVLRREAVLSCRIEDIEATYSELALFELRPQDSADHSDVRKVHNYVAALQHVLDPARRLPLSLRLLREAHEILLTGVLDTATYVPPPPERMWDCLDAFEKYLHAEHALPPLVTIACLHYQFEAIHPFIDGNGRLGRLLVTLLLVEWDLLPAPLLDLSAYLEPRREEYYARLLAVSTDGDWAGWLRFFLDVLAHQAADAHARAVALHSLRESYRKDVTSARASSLIPQLVDALFARPAMTIGMAADLLGVTHRAATQNVLKLVDAGVLTEIAPAGRTRRFLAMDILRTIGD